MARHRNIRTMAYEEDLDDYTSDDYGSSLDNGCVTPETENMYTYARERHESVSKIWEPQQPPVQEEDEQEPGEMFEMDDVKDTGQGATGDSEKLSKCLKSMRSVIGNSVAEGTLREAAISQNFDPDRALDVVFDRQGGASKAAAPQANPESQKAQASQSKQTDPNQHNFQTVPPVETPTRITFNGKDPGPKNAKKSKAVATKDPKEPKVELKVESKAVPRKLSPDTPRSTASPKVPRTPRLDPKAIQDLYDKERTSMKPLLNLVVVGHVDAGKSTLMGHLLYLTGNVSKKTMAKYEHESKKQGKASFAYAWVLDETSEERTRGITMDMAYAKVETEHRCINILDAPGHKDFIPNMITGAAQADVAILVVDATRGEFETGFELGGQTREHTMLVRSLGVAQLSVAVNKLDTCQWSEERFNEIISALKPFLKQTGFVESMVSFVPCSGLTGVNLHERSQLPQLTKWYKGPCLLETIDKMEPPPRPITKPLRMCVADVFKGMQSGVSVGGKIESGCMSQGDKFIIMPSQEPCVVKSLLIDNLPHNRAFAGDNVIVNLDKCEPSQICFGSVICDANEPIRAVSKFEAKVVIFNIDIPVIKGSPVVLHFQSLSEQACFGRLLKELNRNTGEVVREKPRYLSKNSSGVVVIKVARPICVERYQDSKELGRITLRQSGNTIAAGVVTALL
ncbi:HBS1-like protein [Galendromus occidentalis]|uniref:HBS1-like protein n=1 Tax=Galendromus occidentalis TaxID=34638 RepID=A0AAJ6QR16_9ACAR|nr:HBS1-like protein [Galendromus occidentalis]